MSTLNDDLRQALAEDQALLRDLEKDPNIFELIAETFRGLLSGVNILGGVFQLIFMGLTIWSAVRFFDAGQTREQILWATAFVSCLGITTSFKIWFWMVINRNAVIREVKRLELQVARLTEGLDLAKSNES